jgi:hypothetical protein
MCGICGYKLLTPDPKAAGMALQLFEQLLLECEIRGRHATGVAWNHDGKVYASKRPVPAKEFVSGGRMRTDLPGIPTEMIGHTRYSTSGYWHKNINNQPLNNRRMALVHNGLVSMGTKDEFEAQYQTLTATENDSELILRKVLSFQSELNTANALAAALEDLADTHPPIFALGLLEADGTITVVRDHLRPLWLFLHPEWGVAGFASTRDIIERAMKSMDQRTGDYTLNEATPYHVYVLGDRLQNWSPTSMKIAHMVEKRWTRPRLKSEMLPAIDFRSKRSLTALRKEGDILDGPSVAGFRDHRSNLRECFKRYCVAAISTWEIDPNYPLLNYLFRRYELSKSQEYWACYLYGVFYHPGTVFYVMQEFPEFEKVDLGRLKRWHAANWKSLRYNTDRKYEKGHFVEMFESYKGLMAGQTSTSQEEFFAQCLHGKDPQEDFRRVELNLRKLLRFGRYATYIYTEALHRCMGMPIKADTMFLKEAKSSRMGLAIVLGWNVERVAEGKLTPQEWVSFEREGETLLSEIQREYPKLGMDHWFMESCLCAFKGYFRQTKGRYLPYYLDRMLDEIGQLKDDPITAGVDWKVLYQFRREKLIPEYLGEYADPPRWKIQKSMEHVLRDTGHMIGLWPVIARGLLPGRPNEQDDVRPSL